MEDKTRLEIEVLGDVYTVKPLYDEPQNTGNIYAKDLASTQEKAIRDLEKQLIKDSSKPLNFPENVKIIVYPVSTAHEIIVTDRYTASKKDVKMRHLQIWLESKGKTALQILKGPLGATKEKLAAIKDPEEELLRQICEDERVRHYLDYDGPMSPE